MEPDEGGGPLVATTTDPTTPKRTGGPAAVPGGRPHLLTYVDDLARRPDRTAFVWRDGVRWRRRSRGEVRRRVLACARRLAAAGLRRGDHVMIQGPDNADWVEAFLGTLVAGGVTVPVEVGSDALFRDKVARACGARLLVGPADLVAPGGVGKVPLGSWDTGGEGPPPHAPAGAVSGAPAPGGMAPAPDDRAEVLFTSGTTGDPKGVVLTHANIVSDFAPLERIYERHARLVDRAGELRFVTTLPLSHMFGQAISVFLPLAMGLTVIFVPARPRDVMEAVRLHRAWGLFSVPRLIDLLADEVRRTLRQAGKLESAELRARRFERWPFYLQALLHPRVRRQFGWRFRLIVSGGAALPAPVQQFWERFGCLVIQGYGLTETAPIVAVSNPFERRAGSVGRPLGNQEVRLGQGGEVQVRGPNVTPGYLNSATAHADADGWFATGDVGEFDPHGHLVIRGRLKDVIVTAEGENVHPADVEAAFDGVAGVREVAIVGLPSARGDTVHAVLILEPGADPQATVGAANARLQPKQRVRGFTVWTESDFPRTRTGKVRKPALLAVIAPAPTAAAPGAGPGAEATDRGAAGPAGASTAPAVFRRLLADIARVPVADLKDGTLLVDQLGLGSLDLVELTVAMEEELGVGLPEESLAAATVGDLERAIDAALSGAPAPGPARAGRSGPTMAAVPDPVVTPAARRPGGLRMPRWTRGWIVRSARRLLEETACRAVVYGFGRPEVRGLENLGGAGPPYLFVANHHSYLDSGLFKACLPRPLRGRIAPGMTTRYHRVYFGETGGSRPRYLKEWFQVKLVEFLFFAWPLPETAGVRNSLSYAGELADAGESLLIFPEGRHVPEGTIEPFRKGIGIFARELRLPVVPAYITGTGRVLPDEVYIPRFGRTTLVLGPPIDIPPGLDAAEATAGIEAAVRRLAQNGGSSAFPSSSSGGGGGT